MILRGRKRPAICYESRNSAFSSRALSTDGRLRAFRSAYPQITAMQHQYYGDTRTLERKFPSLVKYTGTDCA